MITAVDTTVLIDVFEPDPTFGPRSREALRAAITDGSVIACEMVWVEVVATFPSATEAEQALQQLGIDFSPVGAEAAVAAGVRWRSYRRSGGPRTRLVADFLVGGHAKFQADRLLTRDRGFYRTYFKELRILDPSVNVRRGKDEDATIRTSRSLSADGKETRSARDRRSRIWASSGRASALPSSQR